MGAYTQKVSALISEIGKVQHGAVDREQLLAAGVSRRAIARRLDSGFLVAEFDGVYVLGHGPRAPLARKAAAVLACRPKAMLARRTAASLWGVPAPAPNAVEVAVVSRYRKPPQGVTTLSIKALHPSELRRREGIPITSPALTLLDLAGVLKPDELLGAVHEARLKRTRRRPLVTDGELCAVLRRHPNRRGARALRALLNSEGGVKMTRSKAERVATKLMRSHGIEPDASEHEIGPFTADFWFETERVAVEFDSQAFHDNSTNFVSDRRRARYLAARGILTFPLTDADLGPRSEEAMRELKETLRLRTPHQ